METMSKDTSETSVAIAQKFRVASLNPKHKKHVYWPSVFGSDKYGSDEAACIIEILVSISLWHVIGK